MSAASPNSPTTTLPEGQPVPTTGKYTKVRMCDVYARSKMMFVTAGFDEYFKVMPTDTEPPIDLPSMVTSVLRSANCPTSAFPTPARAESRATTTTLTNHASPTESKSAATPISSKSDAGKVSCAFTLLFGISALAMALQL